MHIDEINIGILKKEIVECNYLPVEINKDNYQEAFVEIIGKPACIPGKPSAFWFVTRVQFVSPQEISFHRLCSLAGMGSLATVKENLLNPKPLSSFFTKFWVVQMNIDFDEEAKKDICSCGGSVEWVAMAMKCLECHRVHLGG